MSTPINALGTSYGNQFYELPGQPQGSNANLSLHDAASALLAQVNPSSSSNGANSDAFMLDLSPQAQQFMNGISSPANSAPANTAGAGFTLTGAEQKQVNDIIAKYKDEPFTQATYEKIQKDLHAIGLAPDQLAMKDKIKSFNGTQMLLDALNGGTADVSSFSTSDSQENTNADAFMQQIVRQWQSVSTTVPPDEASSPA
jgi:hypothetical protein